MKPTINEQIDNAKRMLSDPDHRLTNKQKAKITKEIGWLKNQAKKHDQNRQQQHEDNNDDNITATTATTTNASPTANETSTHNNGSTNDDAGIADARV